MKISSKTNYNILEMGCYQRLSKSEICKRQFRAYLAWARSVGLEHVSHSYYLSQARALYNMYQEYYKLENEVTEIINLKEVA